MHNEYTPFISKILNVKKHTDIEYTFRMEFKGDVKPGQFFDLWRGANISKWYR